MLEMFLFGFALGTGLTLLWIFGNYKVKKREWWEGQTQAMDAARTCLQKLVAENAQLRVALATAEMTGDAKKVAAMAMAAMETDITATEKVAITEEELLVRPCLKRRD
jgi:ApbE superfamily uncharacterized protein (UPF0280 family)